MIVKVCGITRREDAKAAVEFGASALGFIFYKPSPRYVTPEKARELGKGLDVWKVGVFVDETAADVESVMRSAELDVAQVYGAEFPKGFRTWQALRVANPARQGGVPSHCEALFLDSQGNGLSFDWSLARNAAEKVIIAGGLDASNVQEAIRIAQPWGVDASSKLEVSPGIKDHDKMRRFIKAAQETP
jgi:phosphoribosylanthranilate isomerase